MQPPPGPQGGSPTMHSPVPPPVQVPGSGSTSQLPSKQQSAFDRHSSPLLRPSTHVLASQISLVHFSSSTLQSLSTVPVKHQGRHAFRGSSQRCPAAHNGVPAWQTPVSQVSLPLHSRPSSHSEPDSKPSSHVPPGQVHCSPSRVPPTHSSLSPLSQNASRPGQSQFLSSLSPPSQRRGRRTLIHRSSGPGEKKVKGVQVP